MKIIEDNPPALSPVDEENDTDYLDLKVATTKNASSKCSLVNDRRSFYDNHKWSEEMDRSSSHNIHKITINNTDEYDDSGGGGGDVCRSTTPPPQQPKLFKSERSINLNASFDHHLNNNKHERDEFDDLIDLTHRVPRKLFKKEANSNENLPHSARKLSNKLSSSLPPLPPLPYSFVKLERSRAGLTTLANTGSSSSLQNYTNGNNNNVTNNIISGRPLSNKQCQSTTRLIIPINKDYQLTSSSNCGGGGGRNNGVVLKENTNLVRANSYGAESSISPPKLQDEIDIVIYEQEYYSPVSAAKSKYYDAKENGIHHNGGTVHNGNCVGNYVSRQEVLFNGNEMTVPTKPMNGSTNAEIKLIYADSVVSSKNGPKKINPGVASLDRDQVQRVNVVVSPSVVKNTVNCVSSISNTINRLKMENNRPKNRSADMNREWDQISKIFASLETLLNEVVESTTKNLDDSNGSKVSPTSFSSSDKSSTMTSASQNNSSSIYEKHDSIKIKDNTNEYMQIANNGLQKSKSNSYYSHKSDVETSTNDYASFTRRAKNLVDVENKPPPPQPLPPPPPLPSSTTKIIIKEKNNFEISSSINNRKHLKHVEVSEFLKKIGLGRYEYKFISNGYDNIFFLNDVITLQDLLQMGIEDYNDIFSVLSEIKKLPSSIKKIYDDKIKFTDVDKLLCYLYLNEYSEKFLINNINSIEKVKKLWEIELITVIQIPLIGHRRRIMSSIETIIKLDREKCLKNELIIDNYNKSSKTDSELDLENEEEQMLVCSSSSPNLTKKLLSLNSLLTTNKTPTPLNTNTITTAPIALSEDSQSNTGSNLNLINNNSALRRNCLSCRSTFSSNSSTTPSSLSNFTNSKSVKFTDDSKANFNNLSTSSSLINNPESATNTTQPNQTIDTDVHHNHNPNHQQQAASNQPEQSPNYLVNNMLMKSASTGGQQQKKKKFDFHLSRFRKRNCGGQDVGGTPKIYNNLKVIGKNSIKNGEPNGENYFASAHFLDATNGVNNDDYRYPPKPIWKNDPQNLIKGSYNFVVYYLGSSAIPRSKTSQDPVKSTIDRLKNTSKSTPYQSPKVELSVSINGVKLLHNKTKEELCNYDIKHINNVCQDQDDLNYFAFSTQTDPSAHYYCHVFSCKDKDLSTQIILTIGQAFDIAYELFCKNNFS